MSSGHRTSVGPKYLNEKPVTPLVIPTSPNLPIMGDRDELKWILSGEKELIDRDGYLPSWRINATNYFK